MFRKALIAGLLLAGTAHAQSIPNGNVPILQGQVWSPGQWTSAWQSKQDVAPSNSFLQSVLPGVDALPTLNNAFAAIVAAGGGTLNLLPTQYLIASGNLVIPRNVRLRCNAPFMGEQFSGGKTSIPPLPTSENWLAVPCSLIVNPTYSVVLSQQSAIEGIAVVRQGAVAPTSMRTAIQGIAAFSGTGVVSAGIDARMRNVQIIGFNQCFSDSGYERQYIEDTFGDCTNGFSIDNSHDISRLLNVQTWPFFIGHTAWSNNGSYNITGLANNGSGVIRAAFTLAAGAEAPATGDQIDFSGLQGVPYSVRNRYTVTVIDSTHMDLQGSAWPGPATFSANSTSGSPTVVMVSSGTGLGPGMTLAANGAFPSGATVVSVQLSSGTPAMVSVTFSANASSTVSAGVYTISPATITGGAAYTDLGYRSGKAFSFTNGENNSCDHCFDYGHHISFYIGAGAGWTALTQPSADAIGKEVASDVGIFVDIGAYDSIIHGGFLSEHAEEIYQTSASGPANKYVGISINQANHPLVSSTIAIVAGAAVLSGNSLAVLGGNPFGPPVIYVGDDSSYTPDQDKVVMTGNDFHGAAVNSQNATARARLLPNDPTTVNDISSVP